MREFKSKWTRIYLGEKMGVMRFIYFGKQPIMKVAYDNQNNAL